MIKIQNISIIYESTIFYYGRLACSLIMLQWTAITRSRILQCFVGGRHDNVIKGGGHPGHDNCDYVNKKGKKIWWSNDCNGRTWGDLNDAGLGVSKQRLIIFSFYHPSWLTEKLKIILNNVRLWYRWSNSRNLFSCLPSTSI